MTALVAAISGVYGLVIGSFLNVVIWRVPRHDSIVKPPSHCPVCDAKIANRDNSPFSCCAILVRADRFEELVHRRGVAQRA